MNPHQDIRFSHIKNTQKKLLQIQIKPMEPKKSSTPTKTKTNNEAKATSQSWKKKPHYKEKISYRMILKNHHPTPWNKSSNVSNFSIKAKNAPKQILAFFSNYHLQNQISYTHKA